MNWGPVIELLPDFVAVALLLATIEMRRRLERVSKDAKVAKTEATAAKVEAEAVRFELESMRPPKGDE